MKFSCSLHPVQETWKELYSVPNFTKEYFIFKTLKTISGNNWDLLFPEIILSVLKIKYSFVKLGMLYNSCSDCSEKSPWRRNLTDCFNNYNFS
jgi:hypothetical protein